MAEESKPPKKPNTTMHLINLGAGIVGAAICFGFVLLAHRAGLALSELTQEGLIVGGALSAGVSIYSAKKLPGDGQ
jgi:hypothetical protein